MNFKTSNGVLGLAALTLLASSPFSANAQPNVCAVAGGRAQDCGAINPDRPQSCCEGFVCIGGASVKCKPAPAEGEIGTEPIGITMEAAPQEVCATANERSQQCGATNPARPAKCCDGYICDTQGNGNNFLCIADPDALGEGFYQTDRLKYGQITVEGTSFASMTDSKVMRINMPDGSTPRNFVIMFMGDSAGENGERVAFHENWSHLADVGESDAVNLKVQGKLWTGNNEVFRVWDGVNKFVTMPAFIGVDDKNPVVDVKTERFENAEIIAAPSVDTVDGGVVVVMYVLDKESSAGDKLIKDIESKDANVLVSSYSKSGEAMSAFVAPSPEGGGCSGPIKAKGAPATSSGVAVAVSLRPYGALVSDVQQCSEGGEVVAPEEGTEEMTEEPMVEDGETVVPEEGAEEMTEEPMDEEEDEIMAETEDDMEDKDIVALEPTGEPTQASFETAAPTIADDVAASETVSDETSSAPKTVATVLSGVTLVAAAVSAFAF